MGNGHRAERHAGGAGLGLEQAAPDRVHGHAAERLVHGREQAGDLHASLLPEDVEAPGTVLAAAPGEEGLHGREGPELKRKPARTTRPSAG